MGCPIVEKIVNDIRQKLESYINASGVGKLMILTQLRTMIKDMNYNSFVDLVDLINEPDYLDILIGVGLRGIFWHTAVKRAAELMGV